MTVMELPTLGAPSTLSGLDLERWRGAVDLGRRAGLGDVEALAALEPPTVGPGEASRPTPGVLDGAGVHMYVDQQGFGEAVGMAPAYLRYLRRAGRIIQPDVSVGRVWGWSISRAIMWGIEYGYLTPECERITTRTGRAVTLAEDALHLETRPHWRRDVVAYLTLNEAGKKLGITPDSVYQARMRDAGPVEAIRIGPLCGWTHAGLAAYNLRRLPHMRVLMDEPGAKGS